MSQCDLAACLGASLDKANYCLKELKKNGWVKACNFKANLDKRVYAYPLNPQRCKLNVQVSLQFLQRTMDEFEGIKQEINRLKTEVEQVVI